MQHQQLRRFRQALDVLCADLARDGGALLGRDGRLALRGEHAPRVLVPPQVRLGAYEHERGVLAEVRDFGEPLWRW